MISASIIGQFRETARRLGNKPAVTFFRKGEPETILSYSQLSSDVDRFAHTLDSLDVKKGDRVILLIKKSLVAVIAHFAVQRLGAIAVPLNPGFKRDELAYLLADAKAALVITDPDKVPLIKGIDASAKFLEIDTTTPYQDLDLFIGPAKGGPFIDPASEDPGLIVYTSGTTGNPKGAVLTQENLAADARNIIKIWRIAHTDVLCHALPLFHIHGLCFALHTLLLSGGHVRLLDEFKPETVLNLLLPRERNTTIFMAVPAMYTKLMNFMRSEGRDFRHLRLLTSGSAPLLPSEFERIRKLFGAAPVEREGMSETGMNFSNPLTGDRKPGSIGVPLPGVAVRIVDPDTGMDVMSGDIGELWLKSPAITPGYWGKPRETRESFESGWFKTGDLGRVDDEGYYYLTDRIKHIIISGGENVSAKEVETVINQLPEVVESAVVGVPDEVWGEKVVAAVMVIPGESLGEEEIKEHCKEKLHDWKCPKRVVFLEEIPKNTMGKVLKEAVKELVTG